MNQYFSRALASPQGLMCRDIPEFSQNFLQILHFEQITFLFSGTKKGMRHMTF